MGDSLEVKQYNRARRICRVARLALDLAVLVAMLAGGGSISLRDLSERWTAEPAGALLIYLALFGAGTTLVGLPLDFFHGYWLEHRYALSNQTLGGWVKDRLKGFAVGGALAALGLEFVYWTLGRWPEGWWMISGAVFVGFFILLANLAPVLLFPIFFKFQPLENPDLVERLLELSRRAGTRVRGVFEWKLSEKSKKANAALVGLGNTRRIILADTLLEKFSPDEVEAVLAHELGHHVHRHIPRGIAVEAGATFLGFYVVDFALRRFAPVFGFRGPADFANLPLLLLVITLVSLALLPALNAFSRRLERQADAYALRAIPDRSAFITSMEKLATLNLAERRPHPWIEFLFHSHPSIDRRIAFAQTFATAGAAPTQSRSRI